jgi:dihydrofolate reductase
MRQLRYSVAMSLDGFIAGPKGEYDGIAHDPAFDFSALFRQFDTLLMGRRTFDLAQSQGSLLKSMKMKVFVVRRLSMLHSIGR